MIIKVVKILGVLKMKKLNILLCIFLPVILLISGCGLVGNDDNSGSETQEAMFDKYLTATSNSLSAKEYTVITSIIEPDNVSEYSITKNESKYFYKAMHSKGSSTSLNSVVKASDGRYIKYSQDE